MGERREVTEFWWGNQSGRDHLGDSGIDGRKILRSGMCGYGLD
jgi:hypothetical protein